MPRPHKPRSVGHPPSVTYFKPRGVPMADLVEAVLALDELEALRLVDLEGLSHEQAADRMGVSRGTVGRLLERGRRVVVDALLHGKSLRMEGGPVVPEGRRVRRARCCRWCERPVAAASSGTQAGVRPTGAGDPRR
ncbi:MAG: DUF134 domain-containing protein [Polyangiaceae bacterium]|nr:DUF134 domain-containing protein [Polyangiaceae bacterium]